MTSFPAGPEGKRQAELYALAYDLPSVTAELQALIKAVEPLRYWMFDVEAITERAVKGALLIRDGKLLPPVPFDQPDGCLNEIARVQGSQALPYIITYVDEMCFCDCPDFQLEDAPLLPTGQRACKHVLAVLLSEAAQLNSAVPEEIDF